ncbi:hypothetical protein HQ571_02860 [Candidatus Kuenenbacteria bacterium]|nr:hypothetical protein [Candidatus Kuenenbacteria bacterium]
MFDMTRQEILADLKSVHDLRPRIFGTILGKYVKTGQITQEQARVLLNFVLGKVDYSEELLSGLSNNKLLGISATISMQEI